MNQFGGGGGFAPGAQQVITIGIPDQGGQESSSAVTTVYASVSVSWIPSENFAWNTVDGAYWSGDPGNSGAISGALRGVGNGLTFQDMLTESFLAAAARNGNVVSTMEMLGKTFFYMGIPVTIGQEIAQASRDIKSGVPTGVAIAGATINGTIEISGEGQSSARYLLMLPLAA